MGWYARLGDLLAKLAPKFAVNIKNPTFVKNLNIHITNNNNKPTNYDPKINNLILNLEDLDPKIKKQLLSLDMLEEGRILLKDACRDTVEDFRNQENSTGTQAALKFLDKKIPSEDLNIWRAALYIRYFYNKKEPHRVSFLKFQLMQKYGDKGNNIANLCTAGYLEDWLMPGYDKLKETLGEDDLVNAEFGRIYSHLVNQLPFTIFVNHLMSKEQLKTEILRKKDFGIAFINIHAIGDDNIQKVKVILPEIEKEREHCDEVKKHHIFARIYFKDPKGKGC